MKICWENFLKKLEGNLTRTYLVLVNIVLVLFAIVFTNVGLLPFGKMADFLFLVLLALALALYRPSWMFAFFIGSLALENINLAPLGLGISLRPYQLFGFISLAVFVGQIWTKKKNLFVLPKFSWLDLMVFVFVLGGFVSSLFALQKGLAFKQAVVALSFVLIYLLSRIYLQSKEDLKKIVPFFLSSALVVLFYGVWQNIRFLADKTSFEVMPGRPNGTFTEPDWLGVYFTFVLASLFVWLYSVYVNVKKNKDAQVFNQFQNVQILKILGIHILVVLLYAVLLLTVARSAWLGAGAVSAVFILLFILKKDWRGAGQNALGILLAAVLALGIVTGFKLTNFQLFNRAQSTSTGLQKITIACQNGFTATVPQKIQNIEELATYGCRHINLEDIAKEKAQGSVIMEVQRPDPNVGIRAKIYATVWEQIEAHPVRGIGWGNIAQILGTDERGAGLNASNIFLETWLGAGILGVGSLLILTGYLLIEGMRFFFTGRQTEAVFVLLGLVAILVPNLFNSGIFLGFVWVFLGAAVGLLKSNKTGNN